MSSNEPPERLDYYGQVLSASNAERYGAEAFSYRRLVAEEAEDGTIHVVPREESMLSPAEPRANLGLQEGLIAEAMLAGHVLPQHCSRTRNYPTLPPPAEIQPIGGHPVSTHVLRFVQDKERGLILLGAGVGRCAILAELIKAFPRQSFAIMTASHPQSKLVRKNLRELNTYCQRLDNVTNPASAGRVVAGTFDSLRTRAVEFERRTILIAYDAQQALAARAQRLLVQPDVCGRLYGFLGAETHLSPLQEDQVTATFGFEQVAVPALGCCSVEVEARFVEYYRKNAESKKPIAIKQSLIWNDGHRNQILASLARALAVGNCETVAKRLPGVDVPPGPQRVAIVTDSVDHVANLAKRLRSWKILFDPHYCDAGLSEAAKRLLVRGMSPWSTREGTIATPQGLSQVRPGSFDLLIWAGSGSGLPPIPWHHLVCPASAPRRLLLIDVADTGHDLLRTWSRQRRRLYREVGWDNQGRPPTLARIQRFLERNNREGER